VWVLFVERLEGVPGLLIVFSLYVAVDSFSQFFHAFSSVPGQFLFDFFAQCL